MAESRSPQPINIYCCIDHITAAPGGGLKILCSLAGALSSCFSPYYA
jgi:hypothetical protein